jgi:septal ring factor EnvC (AmiA/AmiB activator)
MWKAFSLMLGLAALLLSGALPAAATSSSKAAAELSAVRQRIAQLSADINADARKRSALSGDLQVTEAAGAAARSALNVLSSEQNALSQKRGNLARERDAVLATLASERASLASQLRVGYMVGSTDPLQLLLGQRDPLRASRLLVYYGYFGRARADQIARIGERIARIDVLDHDLQQAETRLAAIRQEQQQRLTTLEQQRADRQRVLEALKRETQSRTQMLARLQTQQSELEQLLRELRRVVRDSPPLETGTAFGRLQGKLRWPVDGRLVAEYGTQRAAGIRWDGVVVAAERGAPVHAVAGGRVVYADWLPGLGLLTIIDHGDGYLSLYGYNEELRRGVGDNVSAGDVVAAAGDTGGRSRTELYFEIRRGGKPINPQPFFSSRSP